MSHELRTPLNAIMGYEQLLTDGVSGPVTERQMQHLGRIRTSASHLLRLIDDVLDISRIEAGQVRYSMQPVHVADAVHHVLDLVAPLLQAQKLSYEVASVEGIVAWADREKLRQILINLLTNACKFTPLGGRVQLSASKLDHGVEIRVRDNGIGIPADKLEAIFEPFIQLDSGHTREFSGAGLGLSISRELARGMGGDLRVQSVADAGATFILTLPATAPVTAEA